MVPEIVTGNLLDQDVEVIVNAWNRNVIPWWRLFPQGVSGAIKKKAGLDPFREVARRGAIPLGGAVLTGAGRLAFRGIIHVAGINLLWLASERSIAASVVSAMKIVDATPFGSVAFPVIGAGSGGFDAGEALAIMMKAFAGIHSRARTVVVRYERAA